MRWATAAAAGATMALTRRAVVDAETGSVALVALALLSRFNVNEP